MNDDMAAKRLKLIKKEREKKNWKIRVQNWYKHGGGKPCIPNKAVVPCDEKPHKRTMGLATPVLDLDTLPGAVFNRFEPYTWYEPKHWNKKLGAHRRWPADNEKGRPLKYLHLPDNAWMAAYKEIEGVDPENAQGIVARDKRGETVKDKDGQKIYFTPELERRFKVDKAIRQDRDLREKIGEFVKEIKCAENECYKLVVPDADHPYDPLAPAEVAYSHGTTNIWDKQDSRVVATVCVHLWFACMRPKKGEEKRSGVEPGSHIIPEDDDRLSIGSRDGGVPVDLLAVASHAVSWNTRINDVTDSRRRGDLFSSGLLTDDSHGKIQLGHGELLRGSSHSIGHRLDPRREWRR